MTKVKVEVVTKSKSGKALRVKFAGNDTWYGARLDAKLEGAKGKMIEAEVYEDEQYGWQIEKWAFAEGGSPSSGTTRPTNGASAPTGNGSDRWYMAFVSNTVAHAISAGKIEGPDDIKAWAAAAKEAAEELA